MSFGKSRRWIDWVPHNAFLAPGQRQDVQRDPQFSFAAAVKSRGPVTTHGAAFGSAVKRDLDPVPRRRSRSGTRGKGRGSALDEDDGPAVYTQFKEPQSRFSAGWGRSGTFGSSRREVAVRWALAGCVDDAERVDGCSRGWRQA